MNIASTVQKPASVLTAVTFMVHGWYIDDYKFLTIQNYDYDVSKIYYDSFLQICDRLTTSNIVEYVILKYRIEFGIMFLWHQYIYLFPSWCTSHFNECSSS